MVFYLMAFVLQFVLEEYKLTDILNDVSKDDLHCLRLQYLLPSQHNMKQRNIKSSYFWQPILNKKIVGRNEKPYQTYTVSL